MMILKKIVAKIKKGIFISPRIYAAAKKIVNTKPDKTLNVIKLAFFRFFSMKLR